MEAGDGPVLAVSIAGCRLTTGPPGSAFIAGNQADQYRMPPLSTATAELLDADLFTVKSFPELK